MHDHYFLERYADETLTDAREFMARERLTRHGGLPEAGRLPGWMLAGLVIILIGLLILAL